MEPVFIARQIVEKHWEYRKDLVMTFIDLEKAYDSVPRDRVWESLKQKDIGEEIIQMIKAMYSNCSSCVKTQVGRTGWFDIENGLKQGSVLSPLLFILVMDDMLKATKEAYIGTRMNIILFADDILIWGENEKVVQEKLDVLKENIEKWGMKISVEKSKTMVMTR